MPPRPTPGASLIMPAFGVSRPLSRAASTMARESGWVEAPAMDAARASGSSSASTTRGLPWVSVPVLSNAMAWTPARRSSAEAERIRMPRRLAAPEATMTAVGAASPSAQGQEMTSTVVALTMPSSQRPPMRPHARNVRSATPRTAGTKMEATLSAVRWIRVLPDWALRTISAMRARVVEAPSAVARTTRRPLRFMLPAMTGAPGARSTGIDSPVTTDSSREDSPSTISPSIATRSPGRTSTRSSGWTDSERIVSPD
ncbi:MAG: hypothetical protein IPJ41_04985 [Phycisphaerales bacterium]|nr:hypothetical protein [Phycisphaerales bacterium]